MIRNRTFFSKIYAECVVSGLVYNFCGHAAKLDSALVEIWKCIILNCRSLIFVNLMPILLQVHCLLLLQNFTVAFAEATRYTLQTLFQNVINILATFRLSTIVHVSLDASSSSKFSNPMMKNNLGLYL